MPLNSFTFSFIHNKLLNALKVCIARTSPAMSGQKRMFGLPIIHFDPNTWLVRLRKESFS